ncbi:hypothetical protein BCR35DRAFT_303353 [Leucosporidium creatinivorum]|uniref:Uncharacterized protein n=1 Tax=Leucosporidium creatinivorum TaxID=106004 RepID=A0A1Y2FHU6_9BASI|nr:hypothetical protein BCR35DRAFT_303353 [Leucosporidium creatinivorum]
MMHLDEVSEFLLSYMQGVSIQMQNACKGRSVQAADPIVFLAAKPEVWATLDPLRRARAVLKAKKWREWIQREAEDGGHVARYHQQRAQGSPAIEQSLAHAYVPSLTSRQSRRSCVSQDELRRRWL